MQTVFILLFLYAVKKLRERITALKFKEKKHLYFDKAFFVDDVEGENFLV